MRSSRSIAIFLAIAGLLTISAASIHAAEQPLRIGVAKVDITPTNLVGLNSFGGDFKDVHDPIFTRALILDNGANTAALVALDVIEVGDTTALRERIQKEIGIPADHIIITASHDHNAPRVGSVTPGGLAHPETKESLDFTATVNDKVVAALQQAKTSLQPARFSLATGKADVNVGRDQFVLGRGWGNGYDDSQASDKTVWVVKFETPDGTPIAILFNYAVHSAVVLGTGRLSGDLGGAAARFVEARYDNKVVALYTMGPAGDQNAKVGTLGAMGGQRGPGGPGGPGAPNGGAQPAPAAPAAVTGQNTVRTDAFEVVNALGLMLGSEVVRVANGMKDFTSTVHIEAAQKTFTCPVKQGVNQLGDMKQEQVAAMPLHLGLILVNDIAITAVSGEVVNNIYAHMKQASPLTNTMMVTIANDRAGYIADDAAYDRPIFEVNGTPFARGCAENGIVNGIVELINKNM